MPSLTARLIKDVQRSNAPMNQKGVLTITDDTDKTLPMDLLLVLDVSTSMGENNDEGIKVLTDSVVHTVKNLLRADDKLAIITFNHAAQVHTSWTTKSGRIGGFASSGSTNFGAAINEVLSFLGSRSRDASRAGIILFLSDGQAGMPKRDKVSIIPEFGFTLHTIGVTSGVMPESLDEMATLANGTYHNAPTFGDVEAAFDSIFKLGATVIYSTPQLHIDVSDGVTISKIVQSPKGRPVHEGDIVGPSRKSVMLGNMLKNKRLELVFLAHADDVKDGDNLLATFRCIGGSTELRVRGTQDEDELIRAPIDRGALLGTMIDEAAQLLKDGDIAGATVVKTQIEELGIADSDTAATVIGTAIDADSTGERLEILGDMDRTNDGKTVLGGEDD